MTVYDFKVNNLEQLPKFNGMSVVSDCDGTLFEHGTTNLYPEVAEVLATVGCLALVSAHPDDDLLEQRKQILDAEISVNSNKPIWYKGKLFKQVAKSIGELSNKAIILGDRPIADVGVAKFIFAKHNIQTLGVRVDRPNQPHPSRADYILSPLLNLSSKLIKATGHDNHFRPRKEVGLEIMDRFINQEVQE